ncbi:hypothetical protein RM844_31920, partial [Streptomyces sp. DSM 44915]
TARRAIAGLATAGALLATTAPIATAQTQPETTATPPSCLTVEEGTQGGLSPGLVADVTNNCDEAHAVIPTWASGSATQGCQTVHPGTTIRYTNADLETDYVGLSFCYDLADCVVVVEYQDPVLDTVAVSAANHCFSAVSLWDTRDGADADCHTLQRGDAHVWHRGVESGPAVLDYCDPDTAASTAD